MSDIGRNTKHETGGLVHPGTTLITCIFPQQLRGTLQGWESPVRATKDQEFETLQARDCIVLTAVLVLM